MLGVRSAQVVHAQLSTMSRGARIPTTGPLISRPLILGTLDVEEPDMNFYEILGISDQSCHIDDIRSAYQRLVAQRSAKRSGDHDVLDGIKAAYDTLSDSQRRAKYDTKLRNDVMSNKGRHHRMLQGIDLDEDDLQGTTDQIRRAMIKQKLKSLDVFRQIDGDGSGKVSVVELTRALNDLGLNVPLSHMEDIFHNFDLDSDGKIDYEEFQEIMREDRTLLVEELTEELREALGLPPKPKLLIESQPIVPQIREALRRNAVTVLELFKKWDVNGNGQISKREFRRVMPAVGMKVPDWAIDEI